MKPKGVIAHSVQHIFSVSHAKRLRGRFGVHAAAALLGSLFAISPLIQVGNLACQSYTGADARVLSAQPGEAVFACTTYTSEEFMYFKGKRLKAFACVDRTVEPVVQVPCVY